MSAWIMVLVIDTIRTIPNKLAVRIFNGYVKLFRNIPLIVQIFLWYFVVPEIVPFGIGNWLKSLANASFVTAFTALGFFTSSQIDVQVSAGINALPRGQNLVDTALGLTL